MHFEFSQETKDLQQQLVTFMEEHIYPNEQRFYDEIERARWSPTRIIEELKPKRTYLTHIAHDVMHARDSAKLPNGVEWAYDGLTVEG